MSVDDIPAAHIHQAWCDPWNRCRICLVEEIDAIILLARFPQQALPEGESTQTDNRWREVRGPWPAVEEKIINDLVHIGIWSCDRQRSSGFFWSDKPVGLSGHFRLSGHSQETIWRGSSGGWALVRVSVEVLDGVP